MRGHTKAPSAGTTSKRAAALAVFACLAVLGPLASSAVALPAPPPGRGYELVSHANANGMFPVVPQFFAADTRSHPVHLSSEDGERLFFRTDGPIIGTNATRDQSPHVAQRGEEGWVQEYVGGPGDRVAIAQLTAVGADFSSVLLSVPHLADSPLGSSLDPADEDEREDFYVRRADGTYELASPSLGLEEESKVEKVDLLSMASGGSTWTYVISDLTNGVFPPVMAWTPAGPEPVTVLEEGPLSWLDVDVVLTRIPLSADGSRAAFVSKSFDKKGPLRIWVRLREEGRTVLASAPEGGISETDLEAKMDVFTQDGKAVLFTTAQALLAEDQDTQVDLYRFDVDAEQVQLLSTAAPGAPSDGQAEACAPTYGVSGCQVLPGAYSKDGSTAYFVSPEQLDAGASEGAPNLYVNRGGDTRLIGVLAGADMHTEEAGWRARIYANRPVRVSPDGRRIVFESRAQLTAHDNESVKEIYVYDADLEELRCASCATSAPNQPADLRNQLPLEFERGTYTTQGRNIANGAAQVYFQTAERLVPRDINGKVDVYEYDVASQAHTLISSGGGSSDSVYLDNSADGEDVFFFSTDLLVPPELDENGQIWKIFDARRGGGFALPQGDDCAGDCRRPSLLGAGFAPPASGLLQGAGNVRARGSCGATARRAARLSRRAKSLRRRARQAPGKRARRLRQRADAYAKRAHRLSRQAKRCRGNNRRASR